jgi:AraC family cel operon transcriptional repressor
MYQISNCTPEHLCRSFRKYLNTSPTKFLNELRVEEATQKIIYTNIPIIDIAMDVGLETWHALCIQNFNYHSCND